MRAAAQWLVIMASTARLLGSTSMLTPVTPRAWARPTSARISAAPTPRPCQASATTTPMSVISPASGLARSTAMAWPMMTPPRTATSTSAWPAVPPSRRSMAGPGLTGAKNLFTRVCSDSPAKNAPSAARSAQPEGRMVVAGAPGT